MLHDRAKIHVEGGAGGNGVISFRREAHVPRGGPDGGDGGRGGDVVLGCDPSRRDLSALRFSPHQRGGRGGHGEGNQRHGARGEDVVVPVPPGTQVDGLDGRQYDLVEPGQRAIVAAGGAGGTATSGSQLDPSGAALRRARARGRVRVDRAAAEAACRRRAGRAAERGQVVAAGAADAGGAEDRRLSVHDPGAGPRDDRRRRAPAGARRHPGIDRGRRRGRRPRPRVPRPRRALPGARPSRRRRRRDGEDPVAAYETVRRELAAHGAGLERLRELVVLSKATWPGEQTWRRRSLAERLGASACSRCRRRPAPASRSSGGRCSGDPA